MAWLRKGADAQPVPGSCADFKGISATLVKQLCSYEVHAPNNAAVAVAQMVKSVRITLLYIPSTPSCQTFLPPLYMKLTTACYFRGFFIDLRARVCYPLGQRGKNCTLTLFKI